MCYSAFVATKFDEIFSGYQPCHVSALNRRFEDHLETSVQYRHVTRLIAREDFTVFRPNECPQNICISENLKQIKRYKFFLGTHQSS